MISIKKAQELLQKKYPSDEYFLVELVIWRDGSGAKIAFIDEVYGEFNLFEGTLEDLEKHLLGEE